MIKKNFLKFRAKARIRKGKNVLNKNIKNFFDWIKGAEIIELKKCETEKDPVRPELDNEFRTSYGRKIYGVKYKDEIHAVIVFSKRDVHLVHLVDRVHLTRRNVLGLSLRPDCNEALHEVRENQDLEKCPDAAPAAACW